MQQPAPNALGRALDRLASVLSTRDEAREWFEGYVEALGPRAVIDTSNAGAIAWVHRRAGDASGVLALPSVRWTVAQVGTRLMQGLTIYDGMQHVQILYGDEGHIAERSQHGLSPGRLSELARVLGNATDGMAASIAWAAGQSDERYGPMRIHYSVPIPGGVSAAWRTGLAACRRALWDGRIPSSARFVVADGLEGTAIGHGTTRAEAEAAYAGEVAHSLPKQRRIVETITDDYDDDGNLIARGEIPPAFGAPEPPPAAASRTWQPEDESKPWSPESEGEATNPPIDAKVDPDTGRLEWGPITLRGPRSDAPPVPPRAECVPYLVMPLEPSPEDAPQGGTWMRLLGESGVTRHVVRFDETDGFMLVGSDMLGLVDLKTLTAELDRIDGICVDWPGMPEFQRFQRYRARNYRWSPASTQRPEGLVVAGGSRGPKFDAGGLDGDAMQAMVRRQRRILRPSN